MKLLHADPALWPVASGWAPTLDAFWASDTGQDLLAHLRRRLDLGATVFPPQPLRALQLTPPESVRVVVLGQDPYHGLGQAEGLAFSVAPTQPWPPSLRNLFVELQRDLGVQPPLNGSLARWARQGVLLLNSALTVEEGAPASHSKLGWEALTDRLITHVVTRGAPKAFLLWGAHAQRKRSLIEFDTRHRIWVANHPSPLSARRGPVPFIGCGHFGQVNAWLSANGARAVEW